MTSTTDYDEGTQAARHAAAGSSPREATAVQSFAESLTPSTHSAPPVLTTRRENNQMTDPATRGQGDPRPSSRPSTSGRPASREDRGDQDVVYHGYHHGTSGAGVVVVEDENGDQLGLLRHVVRHSPTGLSWGYGGSGPADLAWSLLIDALGDDAVCPTCRGTQRVSYDDQQGRDVFCDPARAEQHPELVDMCSCTGGYRTLPYQDFKWSHVSKWDDEWRMRRSDIRIWVASRGETT